MVTEEIKKQREQLVERLKQQTVVIKFNKINGDFREMTCTLQEALLPPTEKTVPVSNKKIREINHEVLSVWDLNAKGWRSFRVDRIVEVTP